MPDDAVKSVRAVVTGRVQGVWFRAWTEGQAETRALSGWVRNRRDGSVEAVFSGPPEAVDSMIQACHDGPPLARVERVDVSPADAPASDGFVTRPTA